MKSSFIAVTILIISMSCGSPAKKESSGESANGDNPNEVLYHQVMDIHDEVMPKMEDLYRMKKELQEKISSSPQLAEKEVKALQKRIVEVDSVSKLMMDWMHEFSPLPDSADQEEAREYLESEMEKIKKVKEAMLETLEKKDSL